MNNDTNIPDAAGIGDTIASITRKLGIDVLAQKIAEVTGKSDCGCNERKETLNELFPYKTKSDK